MDHDELAAMSEPRLRTGIPGPRTKALIEADHRVTSPSLPRAYPFAPSRGAGSMLEDAIKLARNSTRRQYLIAFVGGFHGRSYGSVSLTASSAKYHAGFGPLLPGVLHAPYGVPASEYLEPVIFKRLIPANEVAAVFVEPIQGEGGYVVPPAGWLAELREVCSRHGILFVADEIQSGMGRTGRMWALDHEGVEPDIVLAGKGIASVMPLGAMIARADVMTWDKGAHGSTYA